MLRTIRDENGELTYTEDLVHKDDKFYCWDFKECDNLIDYLRKYMTKGTTDNIIEESAYQYVYDESGDWMKGKWDSSDIERAFVAGAKWMREVMNMVQ